MIKLSHRVRRLVVRFVRDGSGNAAVEFAFVVPLMLTLFFGTVEFSSGVAVMRKVTLVARTMSDLTSQSSSVTDNDLTNFTTTGKAIMNPYFSAQYASRVTQLYIDPTTKIGQVRWSKGFNGKAGMTGTMAVPTALQVGGSYVIYGEVDYKYVPAVGYVMAAAGVQMNQNTYTRPRQSTCVTYGNVQNC